MSIINPQPIESRKLTDAQIHGALTAINVKTDAIGEQMANQAFLLEFVIEKLNTLAETEGVKCAIILEEFEAYYAERVRQLKEELETKMAQDLERTSRSRVVLDG